MSGATQRIVRYGTKVSNTGRSIKESIWDMMEDAIDRLMEGAPRNPRDMHNYELPLSSAKAQEIVDQWRAYGRDQGIAEAAAMVIAWFESPTHPDIDSVRAEAMIRYKQKKQLDELKTADEVNHGKAPQDQSAEESQQHDGNSGADVNH